MDSLSHRLLLADDDVDDCIFFRDVLEDIDLDTTLVTVSDGAELMQYLNKNQDNLPDILFLDLNMPRKSGYECLTEIKQCEKLRDLPIVIFSTSFDTEIVNLLYEKGAHFYIRKPPEFNMLKLLIQKAISLVCIEKITQKSREHFVLKQVQ